MPPTRQQPGRSGRPLKHEKAPTPFGRWLDASGMSIAEFAVAAKVHVRHAYRLRNGEQIPTLPVASRIIALARGKLNIDSFRPD